MIFRLICPILCPYNSTIRWSRSTRMSRSNPATTTIIPGTGNCPFRIRTTSILFLIIQANMFRLMSIVVIKVTKKWWTPSHRVMKTSNLPNILIILLCISKTRRSCCTITLCLTHFTSCLLIFQTGATERFLTSCTIITHKVTSKPPTDSNYFTSKSSTPKTTIG